MDFFECVLQTMPTDMRALQDFEEDDKLQIKANDVITIIEGRSVHTVTLFSEVVSLYGILWFFTVLGCACEGGTLLVARSEQADAAHGPVSSARGDVSGRSVCSGHQPTAQTLLHPHGSRGHGPSPQLGPCRPY